MEVSGQLYAATAVTPYHCAGGCVDPRADMYAMEKRKVSCPSRPARSLIAMPIKLFRIPIADEIVNSFNSPNVVYCISVVNRQRPTRYSASQAGN
jgi:hypothetical protein